MRFFNLTPHDITLVRADGTTEIVPRSGYVARVITTRREICTVEGFTAYTEAVDYVDFGAANMCSDDTIYLVSRMVLDALPSYECGDCFAPDTGAGAVRDEAGRIIGVRSLIGREQS